MLSGLLLVLVQHPECCCLRLEDRYHLLTRSRVQLGRDCNIRPKTGLKSKMCFLMCASSHLMSSKKSIAAQDKLLTAAVGCCRQTGGSFRCRPCQDAHLTKIEQAVWSCFFEFQRRHFNLFPPILTTFDHSQNEYASPRLTKKVSERRRNMLTMSHSEGNVQFRKAPQQVARSVQTLR